MLKKYKKLPIQVKASLWFLICSFLQKGISMLTTPVFTRILTTAEYGEFNVYNSWLGIVSVLASLNLFAGVFTKGLVKNENDKFRYSSAMIGLCTTCIAVVLSIYLVFKDFFNNILELSTYRMILMFMSIWTTSVFNFWAAYQRVEFKYKALVLITIINSIIKPICSIIFILNAEDKVTARIFAIVLIDIFSFGGLFLYHMFKGKAYYVGEYWKHALNFNLPLIPHYLSSIVLASSDRIMIEKMVDAGAAGIYSLAYSISQIMAIFNSALFSTVEPWLYKKLKANQTEGIGKVANMTLAVIACVNLVLIALAPEIVCIFAPVEYYEAVWSIPPVAMSVYFTFAYTFFAVVEFHFEKTHYISYATMSGAVLNIVLNYIFIRRFGYIAAGYTTLICYITYAIAHYFFSWKICNEKMNGIKIYNLRVLIFLTFGFLIIGFILMMTYESVIIRYGIIVVSILLIILMHKGIVNVLKNIFCLKNEK